ncbi:MAG: Gldg family protein [Xanthomonadales bacterium]|nr:Gldg family protein [Xanthomonadales bacterium]
MNAKTRRQLTAGSLGLLAVLFVAAVVISNALLRGLRLDLTAHGLYTLSPGTREVLAEIDEPINLYFFFSDRASANLPFLRNYAQRVREFLEELQAAAGGKVRLTVIDPLPFSEDEDRAAAFGLQAVPLGPGGETVYFGLAGTNATDGQAVIPFFQPDKETFLEYDVAKLVQSLARPKRPVVGLLSQLPIGAGFDPATRQMREPQVIVDELRQLFELRELNHGVTEIPEEVRVLVLVHPKNLSDDTLYAIDQFVLRGGRLLVFVDPYAELDDGGVNPEDPMSAMFASRASNLAKLFDAWGIAFPADKVVLDRGAALQVSIAPGQLARHAAILGYGREHLNGKDVITAQLSVLNFASPGQLTLKEGSTLSLEPLVHSTREAMLVPSERLRFLGADPSTLLADYTPGNEHLVLAGRFSGPLKTAFPERSGEKHRAEAAEPVQMIVVADTDLLGNRLWVQLGQFFGQRVANAFAANGDFVVNAVDNLLGSGSLISIRGRALSVRPFTTVDALRRQADERFRAKERELQQQLSETERRLNELQQQKGEQQTLVLSPEQRAELLRFQQEKLRIRKELREVRRQLDADIEALGARLKFLNIVLVPALVIVAALLYGGWQLRRRRRLAAEV